MVDDIRVDITSTGTFRLNPPNGRESYVITFDSPEESQHACRILSRILPGHKKVIKTAVYRAPLPGNSEHPNSMWCRNCYKKGHVRQECTLKLCNTCHHAAHVEGTYCPFKEKPHDPMQFKSPPLKRRRIRHRGRSRVMSPPPREAQASQDSPASSAAWSQASTSPALTTPGQASTGWSIASSQVSGTHTPGNTPSTVPTGPAARALQMSTTSAASANNNGNP